MQSGRSWTLGTKLALVGTPFLLLALVSIGLTLWVSWQLDGGAAAVNEAGRMRMQTYRLALSAGTGDAAALSAQAAEFDRSVVLLRHGDPERPLLLPWDERTAATFAQVEADWQRFRARWAGGAADSPAALRRDAADFSGHIDALVTAIEAHLSR